MIIGIMPDVNIKNSINKKPQDKKKAVIKSSKLLKPIKKEIKKQSVSFEVSQVTESEFESLIKSSKN